MKINNLIADIINNEKTKNIMLIEKLQKLI